MIKHALLTAVLVSVTLAGSASTAKDPPACAVTEAIQAKPPDDPNADPFGYGPWQINQGRTIWATWGMDRLKAGPKGNKVLWIRPAGTQITVSGRRLDATAPPMKATLPCCYPTGFQASGLHFPTAGCWRVDALAGTNKLTFVTRVEAEAKRPE
jgi:hypothetical protein